MTKLTPLPQKGFIIHWCIDIHFHWDKDIVLNMEDSLLQC